MSNIRIEGKVAFQPISGGFWGIIGNDGRQWRPVNLPSGLQQEGTAIAATVAPEREQFSIFMWGTAVRIVELH
jgi:hypothetical protein